MKIEWAKSALSDLDRIAQFAQAQHPEIANVVGPAILRRAEALATHPRMGRRITSRPEYRQAVLRILNASYVFRYRYDGTRLVILRVFHGRESRE